MDIPEIKERLTILHVISYYGLKPNRNKMINCPFHNNDTTASLQVYPKTNTYNCFACGKTGDVVQFIQDFEKISKHEAILKAESFITQTDNKPTQPEKSPPNEHHNEIPQDFTILFAEQQKAISPLTPISQRSPKAMQYLTQRGLENIKEVGFNSGGTWKKLKQCITFPLKDAAGNIVSLYGRRISDGNGYALEYGRHYYSENRRGLYPGYPHENTEILILTEAVIDATTLLLSENITSHFTLLAAYGVNGLTKEHKAAMTQLKKLKGICFFFDGDAPGRQGVKTHGEEIQKLLPSVTLTHVETPTDEDINSLYVKYGEECLVQLIAERRSMNESSFSSENILPVKQYKSIRYIDTSLLQSGINKKHVKAKPAKGRKISSTCSKATIWGTYMQAATSFNFGNLSPIRIGLVALTMFVLLCFSRL